MNSNPDWPAAVPEAEWTPFQRWMMEARRKADLWERHQSRLLLWAERRRQDRQWVSLAEIADWCARVPGDVARDEQRRAQAWRDLLLSAQRGDFISRGRLRLAYVPPFNMQRPGPISSRLIPAQLSLYTLTDCWLPQELAARWLAERRLDLMPGMVAPPKMIEASPVSEGAVLPPFDAYQAQAMMIGLKKAGAPRPSREEAQAALSGQFSGVSRDKAEGIVKKVWGEGIRGPRKPRNSGPKAKV